jgi:hypothetical protein
VQTSIGAKKRPVLGAGEMVKLRPTECDCMGVQEPDKHAKTVEIHLLCSGGGATDEPS